MPYPLTPTIGLPLVPDGDQAWGQAMRDALTALDGIASIERQVAATTPPLGFYETTTLEVNLSQAADLTVLTTDHPAWVRIYGSAAARTEDATRNITTKVTDGRGCFGDAITYLPDGLTLTWSEVPTFQNLDTPRTGTAYLAVTSMDPTYSGPINLTLTFRERGPRTGALQGLAGLDGHTILTLARDPVATDGKDGDIAINTLAWTVFAPKAAGAWPAGVSLVGPQGASGTPGTNGTNGLDGKTVRYGAVDPVATDGVDGDFWINTTTHFIFGPKASGAWPAGASLVGPQGAPGMTVPVGVVGTVASIDSYAPTGATSLSWAGQTGYSKIAGAGLILFPSAFYVGIDTTGTTVAFPLTSVYLKKTNAGSSAVISSRQITFGGSSSPTLPAGKITLSDAISDVVIDSSHDYYVVWYAGSGISSSAGIYRHQPNIGGNNGYYGNGDHTGDSTIPAMNVAYRYGSDLYAEASLYTKTIRYGAADPTATDGADGDFYINTASHFIFGPKASGSWPAGTSLVGPAGGADTFSTTETATNKIWINGKTIYRKVINFGALPASTTKSVPHGITGATAFLGISGYAYNGTDYLPLPLAGSVSGYNTEISVSATSLVVKDGADLSNYSTCFVVLEYTK